jgi:hypothetical protein
MPRLFTRVGQRRRGRRDEHPVPRLQHKAAARHAHLPGAQHRAHEHLAFHDAVQPVQRRPREAAVLLHAQLHDLHAALGKGVPPQKARQAEQPLDLHGGLPLGVDRQRQRERIPHRKGLLRIFRIADACNRVQRGVQVVCRQAAQQVHLVRARRGDQQIRLVRAGLLERVHGRAVSVHGQQVVFFHRVFQHLPARIDHGQLIPFRGELPRQGRTHLAVTCNDNFHTCFLMRKSAFMRDTLQIFCISSGYLYI